MSGISNKDDVFNNDVTAQTVATTGLTTTAFRNRRHTLINLSTIECQSKDRIVREIIKTNCQNSWCFEWPKNEFCFCCWRQWMAARIESYFYDAEHRMEHVQRRKQNTRTPANENCLCLCSSQSVCCVTAACLRPQIRSENISAERKRWLYRIYNW